MTNKNKIILIFLLIQFSLFSACAETEEDKSVKEEKNITVLNRTSNDFYIQLQKSEVPLFILIGNEENVEFNTQYHYTFKKLLDTFKFSKADSKYPIKFVSDTTLNVLVKNLSPQTDYYISAFTADSLKKYSVKISTLIQEPNQQALQLVNTESTDNSVTVRWTEGNGQNRIVVIRKDQEPENPKDGIIIQASDKYGDKLTEYGNGNFVIFDSKYNQGNKVTIENLKYGNYYVKVFEYNGEGDYTNYFTENSKMNPVMVQTLLPPPENLRYNFSTGNTFMIEWDKLNDSAQYEFQVALDENFNEIVNQYDGINTGDANHWEIPVDVISNNKCYYRVRAIHGSKKSMYSKPLEVKIK